MIKTSGVVLDFYDDNGDMLKEKLASTQLPPYVEEAEIFDSSGLSALPDHSFAAVLKNGEETLRKYACIDKGNVAISTLYFLWNKDKLPEEAKVKIAHNLLQACRYFEMMPPLSLLKEAGRKTLIKGDGAEIVTKKADLTGTNDMPRSAAPRRLTKEKVSSFASQWEPHIDVTSMTLTPTKEDDNDLYALTSVDGSRQFPLATYEQVKVASDFFDQQGVRLHPRTRHEFCTKVAARADALGVEVSDDLKKYGSATYAPAGEMKLAFETRQKLWRDGGNEEGLSLLEQLLEKKAGLEPETFAEVLAQIDILTGSDRLWDREIIDPWASTLGKEKTAEWFWAQGADVVKEDQLRHFVTMNHKFLQYHFSKDLADAIQKDPTGIFDSLPLEQKRVIARMAQQSFDGGASSHLY